jgi:hypothetical protein
VRITLEPGRKNLLRLRSKNKTAKYQQKARKSYRGSEQSDLNVLCILRHPENYILRFPAFDHYLNFKLHHYPIVEQINRWPLRIPDKTTEKPRFPQSSKGHYRCVTNPVLQDAARIELVPPEKRETPALEVVLSLARREVFLAPNGLDRMRSLQHEAELILGLSAAFAGHL